MEKCYVSKNDTKVIWESNTMARWQIIRLYKYGDKGCRDCVWLSVDLYAHPSNGNVRQTDTDYRIDMLPAFAPLPDKPYPASLRAEMVYNTKPKGYGGKTSPDKILIWGLRGACATSFTPDDLKGGKEQWRK